MILICFTDFGYLFIILYLAQASILAQEDVSAPQAHSGDIFAVQQAVGHLPVVSPSSLQERLTKQDSALLQVSLS